ncbi:MAG: TrmH family RNA methyltransferase [Brevundimonas sp.]
MKMIAINDPNDPRISAFRDIRERDLTGREGLFVAEGTVVLRGLASVASRCEAQAVLIDSRRVKAHAEILAGFDSGVPVYVGSQDVIDAVAGFHLHRGVLALGLRPEPLELGTVKGAQTVVVACGIGNHDNMGGIFRNAAAFGADAVVLDERCCDPFYRKAIRVSVGAVLRTPIVAGGSAGALVERLMGLGFDVVAMTPAAREPLHLAVRKGPTAILLGSEGPGLPAEVIARCRAVSIPMSGGFDSLNVATTAALALNHFTREAV